MPPDPDDLLSVQQAALIRLAEIQAVLGEAGIPLTHPITLIALLWHVQSCYMVSTARHAGMVVPEGKEEVH